MKFDLICVGAGPGGLAAAQAASKLGAKVALIEKDHLGGTCLNHGCIPKKIMHYAGKIGRYNYPKLNSYFSGISWSAVQEIRNQYINKVRNAYASTLNKLGITLFTGEAKFIDSHTIEVTSNILTGANIIISTGGAPRRFHENIGITSQEFFQLPNQPMNVVIVGAGYIGMELASILINLGSKVTVVTKEELPLPGFDRDVRIMALNQMMISGISVLTQQEIKSLTADSIAITDTILKGYDQLIWCIGRSPVNILNSLDININHSSTLDYQTVYPNVFLIGDANEIVSLAPAAVRQGRHVAHQLYDSNYDQRYAFPAVHPTAVYTTPTISKVGLTESEARDHYGTIKIYTAEFVPMSELFSLKPQKAYIKLIVTDNDSQTIIGFHMIGDSCDEITQMVAVIMGMEGTKRDLDRALALHPTIAEEIVTLK